MERIILAFAVLVLIGITPAYAEEIYIITDLGNIFKVEMVPAPPEAEISKDELESRIEEYLQNRNQTASQPVSGQSTGITPSSADPEIYIITELGNMFKVEMIPAPPEPEVSEEELQNLVWGYLRDRNPTEPTQVELDQPTVNSCIIDLPYNGLSYDLPRGDHFSQTNFDLNPDCTYVRSNLDADLVRVGFEDRTNPVDPGPSKINVYFKSPDVDETTTFTGNYTVIFDKTDGSTSESIIPISFTIHGR